MDIFNQNWQQRLKNDELTRRYLSGDGREYVKVPLARRLRENSLAVQWENPIYNRRSWEQMVRNPNFDRIHSRDGKPMKIRDMEVGIYYFNPFKIEEEYVEDITSYDRVHSLYNLNYATLR